jgi:uncharacterized protein (TIGR00251 family)
MEKIAVKVKPGSKQPKVVETEWGLLIHLISPALRGKANRELVKTVAKYLNIPVSKIVISSGEKSRNKVLLISG